MFWTLFDQKVIKIKRPCVVNCSKLSVSVKGLQVDSTGHHHEWKLCKSWWWSQHLLCGVCFCVLIASSHNFCRVSSWYSPTRCRSVTRTLPYFFFARTVQSIYHHYSSHLFERLSTPSWYWRWCPSWTVWSILWSRNVAWTSRKRSWTQTEDTLQPTPIVQKQNQHCQRLTLTL